VVDPKSVIHSEGWRGDNGSEDLDIKSIIASGMAKIGSPSGETIINGSEFLESFAKARFMKFSALSSSTVCLHLNESEF
jgi:hypothetical protein